MQKILLLALVIVLSSIASGQPNDWVHIITRNVINKSTKPNSYLPAPHGYALYFSKSGKIYVPYLVYVPEKYNPAKPASVIVFLHGAILARDSFQYKNATIADEPIFPIADAYNTLVIFPFARNDHRWSGNSPAYQNVIDIIKQVEEYYNVDKKKIYIGGISMGGIATFWFINHAPEMFAGFYTFSALPRLSAEAINFSLITDKKPLYSINTKDDQVFAYSEVAELYQQHISEAKGWHFESVETGGHRFIYSKEGALYVKSLIGKLLKQ